MNVLLLGATGQLGQAWIALSKSEEWPKGFNLISYSRQTADLSQPEKLITLIEEIHASSPISMIINTAAYTQVDLAENERKNCRLINSISPAKLADFCATHHIKLIHYSTDYVYSGKGDAAFTEEENYQPLNYYGLTKSEADAAIEESGAPHLIFRASWVYSYVGKNFLHTMLKLGKEREQLKIVSDQIGSPTYAPDLAHYTLEAIKKSLVMEALRGDFPSGVYHLCNSGTISWSGFAEEIFKLARAQGMQLAVKEVSEIPSSEYPTPAKRPLNSRLNLGKIEHTFQIKPRSWKVALAECLQKVEESKK